LEKIGDNEQRVYELLLRSITKKFNHWVYDKVWKKIDPQKQVLHLQINITNSCNLQCSHCYHQDHNNKGALTYSEWCCVIDQYALLLKKLHMIPNIVICGGEPLMAPFLFELIDYIRCRFPDCEIGLLSNGTLITLDIAQKLFINNVAVQVSFDGPDAHRHDLFRGMGNFKKAVFGCHILKENGVRFHHLSILSKRTAAWIPDFFELPQVTGAVAMNFVRLVEHGKGKEMCDLGSDSPLEGLELKSAMENILALSQKTNIPTATNDALWNLINSGLGFPNNIGFSGFVVDYSGGFKVTSRTPLVLGNVFEEGMEALLVRHPMMKQLRKGNIRVCGDCSYFNKCRGDRSASYSAYGDFFGPDPGCWLLTK